MYSISKYVETVDNTFIFILAVSVAFIALITFLMIYFVIKYNRKKGHKATNIHGNLTLELVWTLIPVAIALVMFYYGYQGYAMTLNPPADSMVVKVTGQMWKWTFEYENGIKSDTLYVPVNKNVRCDVTSQDVNHAFYIPAFRLKKDAIATRINVMWFNADKLGRYDVACAEYCGLSHSHMYTKVVVMPQNDFADWFTKEKQKLNAAAVTQ